MNREQLAHVLRVAASITGDGDIVVLGSQSILGTFSDARLPEEATMSVEADLAWRHDPDAAKADLVDGAIGEGSQFHSEWGYYAQALRSLRPFCPPDGRTASRSSIVKTPGTPGRSASNRTISASPNSSPAARRTSVSSPP